MVSSILLDTSNYDSTYFLVFSSSLELALFFQRKTFCWDRTRDSLWNSGLPIQSPLLLAVSCSAISYQRMADKLYVIDAPSLRFFILTFEEENLIYSDFNLETLQRTNERTNVWDRKWTNLTTVISFSNVWSNFSFYLFRGQLASGIITT